MPCWHVSNLDSANHNLARRPRVGLVTVANMDTALGSPDLFLLLTGGFGVSVWSAVARRDGPSTLAMAVGALGTAHLAGLPAWLLIWGCTIVSTAFVMSLTALPLRWVAGSDAYRISMLGTIAMVLLLTANYECSLPSTAAAFGDQSLAFGGQIHKQVEGLISS